MNSSQLSFLGQEHLLEEVAAFSPSDQARFFHWLDSQSINHLIEQKKAPSVEKLLYTPWTEAPAMDPALGEALLSNGKTGFILLAGGQGSRLGWENPKGTFPVSLIQKKSLFQLFCERVCAAQRKYENEFPVAILTSPLNHQATIDFFRQKNFWGLSPNQVTFFSQSTLPFVDEGGKWFWERPGIIAEGPDGNGGLFEAFAQSGLLKEWRHKGVQSLSISAVDNPLADPLDPRLFPHSRDLIVGCIPRTNPQESMGILAQAQKRLHIVEYFDLTPEMRQKNEGGFLFPYANIGLYGMTLDFMEKMASLSLPLHLVKKEALSLQKGKTVAWKSERFLFDSFACADQAQALLLPRENSYAPLKDPSSIPTLSSALLERDRMRWRALTGEDVSQKTFELSMDFYYPTEKLLAKTKDLVILNNSYIRPLS